jgi:hypothetical protein
VLVSQVVFIDCGQVTTSEIEMNEMEFLYHANDGLYGFRTRTGL